MLVPLRLTKSALSMPSQLWLAESIFLAGATRSGLRRSVFTTGPTEEKSARTSLSRSVSPLSFMPPTVMMLWARAGAFRLGLDDQPSLPADCTMSRSLKCTKSS